MNDTKSSTKFLYFVFSSVFIGILQLLEIDLDLPLDVRNF